MSVFRGPEDKDDFDVMSEEEESEDESEDESEVKETTKEVTKEPEDESEKDEDSEEEDEDEDEETKPKEEKVTSVEKTVDHDKLVESVRKRLHELRMFR